MNKSGEKYSVGLRVHHVREREREREGGLRSPEKNSR